MRVVPRLAALAAVVAVAGCRAFEPAHVIGTAPSGHWWHQLPAMLGIGIAIVPASIVALPVMFVEEVVGVDSVFSPARKTDGAPPPSSYLVFLPSAAFGYVVALPFVIVGLPFESRPVHVQPEPVEPPADAGQWVLPAPTRSADADGGHAPHRQLSQAL